MKTYVLSPSAQRHFSAPGWAFLVAAAINEPGRAVREITPHLTWRWPTHRTDATPKESLYFDVETPNETQLLIIGVTYLMSVHGPNSKHI